MKAIICGAGRVGYNIAHYISQQGVDVSVIDQSKQLISKISDGLSVRAFIGHASDPEVLARAGGEDTDIMLAVTRDDEVNMLSCQIGYSLFGISTKIARLRNPQYLSHEGRKLFSDEHIPVDVVISPENGVAEHIERNFAYPGVLEIIPMAGGQVDIIGVRCPSSCSIINTPLKQLTSLFPDLPIRVLAIIRGGVFFIPKSTESILAGDEVYFSVSQTAILRALDCFGLSSQPSDSAVILGGGRIGQHLAEQLCNQKNRRHVTIIEKNREIAYAAAERFPSVNVINGDILDEDILAEANLSEKDTVACVTNNDEANIFGALLARNHKVKAITSIVTSPAYRGIAESLNIGSIIRPSEVTISEILSYVRLGRIYSVHSLRGAGEIMEAEITDLCPLAGFSLREIKVKGIIAGAIVRDGEIIIPGGGTQFKSGDKVVFVAEKSSVKQAEKLFSAGM